MKSVYEDRSKVPVDRWKTGKIACSMFLEDSLVEPWLAVCKQDFSDEMFSNLIVEDALEVFIDGGGCVSTREPTAEVEIEGHKFSSYLRHIEFFLPAMRTPMKDERFVSILGPYVQISGKYWTTILSVPLGHKVANAFVQVLAERQTEVDEEWNRIDEVKRSSGALLASRDDCIRNQNRGLEP